MFSCASVLVSSPSVSQLVSVKSHNAYALLHIFCRVPPPECTIYFTWCQICLLLGVPPLGCHSQHLGVTFPALSCKNPSISMSNSQSPGVTAAPASACEIVRRGRLPHRGCGHTTPAAPTHLPLAQPTSECCSRVEGGSLLHPGLNSVHSGWGRVARHTHSVLSHYSSLCYILTHRSTLIQVTLYDWI